MNALISMWLQRNLSCIIYALCSVIHHLASRPDKAEDSEAKDRLKTCGHTIRFETIKKMYPRVAFMHLW